MNSLTEILLIILISLISLVFVFFVIVIVKKNRLSPKQDQSQDFNNNITNQNLKDELQSLKEINNISNQNLKDELQSLKELSVKVKENLIKFETGSNSDQKNLIDNFTNSSNKINDRLEDFSKRISSANTLNKEKSQDFIQSFCSLQNEIKQINNIEASNKENINKIFTNINNLNNSMIESRQNNEIMQRMINSLNQIFISNSDRGRLGEVSLRFILQSIFGTDNRIVQEQKVFNELRPDFYIEFEDIFIVIDSKFPYQNFKDFIFHSQKSKNDNQKMIKQLKINLQDHIKKMTDYLQKSKGFSHVIMFLPSQALTDFIYEKKELSNILEQAMNKEIIIASPTTLPVILSIFNNHHKQLKRTKNVKKILELFKKLGDNFRRFHQRWDKFNHKIEGFEKDTNEINTSVKKLIKNFEQIDNHDHKLIEETKKNK